MRLSRSVKELSSYTLAPFLSLDTSLPHQRPENIYFEPFPRQNQYPVWYFFYGRLLEPELLQRQLNLPSPPTYRPARVRRARMCNWHGKYNAVVGGQEDDVVDGGSFLVEHTEQEEILQFFETDMYEVVRCQNEMMDERGETLPGFVFRFCGSESELV